MATRTLSMFTSLDRQEIEGELSFWAKLTEEQKKDSVDESDFRSFNYNGTSWTAWGAAGPVKDIWNDMLFPQVLKPLLDNNQELVFRGTKQRSNYIVLCWMVGHHCNSCFPAVIFAYHDLRVSENAIKLMRKSTDLNRFGFQYYPYNAKTSSNAGAPSLADRFQYFGFCGAPIITTNEVKQFQKKATIGGAIVIDGKYFGITVAHAFFPDPDVNDDELDSESPVADKVFVLGEDGRQRLLGTLPCHPDHNAERSPSSKSTKYYSRELDWALIEFEDYVVPGLNVVALSDGTLIFPWAVTSSFLKGQVLVAVGGREPINTTVSETKCGIWAAHSGVQDAWGLNMVSKAGDSGSWVLDPVNQSILGSVVARCEGLNMTFAIPSERIFDDIRSKFPSAAFPSSSRRSMLIEAVRSGNQRLGDLLLQASMDPTGQKALSWAAGNGHEAVVRFLLSREEAINVENITKLGYSDTSEDRSGLATALGEAASNGHKAIVQLLLEKGADIGTENDLSCIALHGAAKNGHNALVHLLLETGIDVNLMDTSRRTALHEAAIKGYLEVVRLLLANGAHINAISQNGRTALHEAAIRGHLEVVRLLLANGAHINAISQTGRTALHEAAANGHLEVVRLLLANGAHINAFSQSGWTALHEAAAKGRLKVVRLLLANGAHINAISQSGRTALHEAASNGHRAVMQILFEKGANINAANVLQPRILHEAASNGHEDMVQSLLDIGVDVNARAAPEMGLWLRETMGNDTINDSVGWTALHGAASKGHMAVVRLLLANGAHVNTIDEKGQTALLIAMLQKHKNIVRLLIEKGADINTIGEDGRTALHEAAFQGDEAMVRLLLDNGADVNVRGRWYYKRTALFEAVSENHEAIVRLLLEKGAEVDVDCRARAYYKSSETIQQLLERSNL